MAAYPLDDSPRSPTQEATWDPETTSTIRRRKYILNLAGIKPRFFDLPTRSLNAIPTGCVVLLQPRRFSTNLFVFFYGRKLKIQNWSGHQFYKMHNMFNENPSLVIMQSRKTVTRSSDVQSYKICKLFYDQSSVVITLEFTWPKDKQKSKLRYKTNIKYWQCQKGKVDIRKWRNIIRIILITHWLLVGRVDITTSNPHSLLPCTILQCIANTHSGKQRSQFCRFT
jgi:hypothetical protein